jgi:hypothetical protein
MVETVTLGWIGQAHPSFGCRYETKERISKLIKSEYPNMQYAFFPRAFHYVTDKNVKMTTRGIALQIMKHADVPVAKFREELVRKWQNLDEESGNPLGTQFVVPVGRVANLGIEVMWNLFLRQNQFLRNTKMQLVHNLNDMDEIISLDLNKYVDLDPEYLTLRNILRSFKVRRNPVIQSIERTTESGNYKLLYHTTMEKHVQDSMEHAILIIDITSTKKSHHTVNSREQMRTRIFGPAMPSNLVDPLFQPCKLKKTMNAPPPRSIRNAQV